MSYVSKCGALLGALMVSAAVFSSANAAEIKLATPEEALAACKGNSMGQWDISYFIGKDGVAQWGPGYGCKQSPVPGSFSGVGNAIQAGGATVTLASPDAALAACKANQMGQWDIAYIVGKDGTAQWGPGYGCKQSPVPGSFSGVGNALTK